LGFGKGICRQKDKVEWRRSTMAAPIDTINSINKFLVIQQLPDMQTQGMFPPRSMLDYHMLMLADNRLAQIQTSPQTERSEAENERINDREEKHRYDTPDRRSKHERRRRIRRVTVKLEGEHLVNIKV